ncbi:MAG TPA: TldD/PmbA family protein [Phenylobacterium sp.]|nr:TldD/PmbA family protein [Phenylobacterium sp.]
MDENLLADVVAAALRAGADAAEAVGAQRRALGINVRLGKLEEVEREESRDLGLRVFIGKQHATVSGSDISPEARAKLVERAVAMARLAPEDPYSGLADPAGYAKGPLPDLDLYDTAEPSPESLEETARAAEDAARAMPRISNSEGGSSSASQSEWRLVTSNGFSGVHRASGFSIGASVVAGDGDEMESGYDGRSARWLSDLPTPESIGAEAGRRAAARLGARKIASTTAPVIFENRLATSLIGPLLGAISGPSIARGNSFLKDKLGQQVFAKGINIVDDPHKVRGLGSSPFDDEGVANRVWSLIDDGVLTTWLMNSSSARQLGLASTGHASRGLAGPSGVGTSNLTVQPGDKDQAGLMRDAGSGVLITSMFGPSLNGNTGDWSVGCAGFWFENGEVAYPVAEITVAGNLIDIYSRLVVGSDLEIRGSANSPSILVDGLAIAGK